MTDLLVTGGAGFIGASFVHHVLRERGDVRITVLDKVTYAGSETRLEGLDRDRCRLVRGDIADAALVDELGRVSHMHREVRGSLVG